MNINPMTPITAVKVLQAVPLDNSYKDTLTFENVSAQTSFFTGKAKTTYTNLSPINLYNAIRLPVCADDIYDCNYIMFQNANFKTKWFYAFITKINYVNPNMCQVEFEIDVMQTWYFDYTINPCFVEREHTNDDRIGTNLLPEPTQVGECINEKAEKPDCFNSYSAVIMTAEGEPAGYIGGMFSGLHYVAGKIDNADEVQTVIDFLKSAVEANKQDSIVSTYVMPSYFFTTESAVKQYNFAVSGTPSKVGSYTPINKKLLTYPYTFLMVTNQEGQQKNYRYEYFSSHTEEGKVGFTLLCGMGSTPEVLAIPIDYNFQSLNYDESLSLSGFPEFAFQTDTYRAWRSQNDSGNLLSMAGNVIGAGNAYLDETGGVGSILNIANVINQNVLMSFKGDTPRGSQGSSTLTAIRAKNFAFYNRHIREDIAKSIDDYFSMYGYATEVTKKPNITGRKSWNYVKTKDSKITGSIPFEDIEKIRSIFDNGVTFWHGDYVGHYERDNSIIGG